MNDNLRSASASTNGQTALKDRVKELQLGNRLGETKSGSSGPANWLPWMLCMLLALAWAFVGVRWYKSSGSGPTPTAGADIVKNKKPTDEAPGKPSAAGEVVLESKGYLIPSHSISVSPIDVAGRIIELNIEEGWTRKKGEVLAKIDSTRFAADMQESEAQLASAKAKLDELLESSELETKQAKFELAEAQAQKADAWVVYETAKTTGNNAVSRVEVTQASKKYDAAAEHVNALEIKLTIIQGKPREHKILAAKRDFEAAKARLDRSAWTLDNCTIRSPVTGVILTKKAEIGSLINPVVGGVSTSLCEIADLSKIEVDLEIQERDIAKIRVGMVCRIRPDAYADRVYDGFVDRMMPIANRARGIVPVRVRVLFPVDEVQGRYLKPEMGVTVTFVNQDSDPAVRIAAETGYEMAPLPRKTKTDGIDKQSKPNAATEEPMSNTERKK
jgi:HlyD family secretion protein